MKKGFMMFGQNPDIPAIVSGPKAAKKQKRIQWCLITKRQFILMNRTIGAIFYMCSVCVYIYLQHTKSPLYYPLLEMS